MSNDDGLRYLIDPYLDWAVRQGVPIVEGIAVDLHAVETAPWPRLGGGCRAAFVQLRGRGDFVGLHVIDIPPGGATDWARHLYDEVFYVLSGHGSTIIEAGEGQTPQFRMGAARAVLAAAELALPAVQRLGRRAGADRFRQRPAVPAQCLPQREFSVRQSVLVSRAHRPQRLFRRRRRFPADQARQAHVGDEFRPRSRLALAAGMGGARRRQHAISRSSSRTARCTRTRRRCRSAPTRRATVTAPARMSSRSPARATR